MCVCVCVCWNLVFKDLQWIKILFIKKFCNEEYVCLIMDLFNILIFYISNNVELRIKNCTKYE